MMATSALQGWHPGETSIQRQLGFASAVSSHWTRIEDRMREQHRTFYTSNLPFITLTTTDADGRPWASIVAGRTGEIGFLESRDLKTLVVRARLWEGDPLIDTLKASHASGGNREGKWRFLTAGLGIEFSTRRRNKFAGQIEGVSSVGADDVFSIAVNEAVGNCPKYINVRQLDPYPYTNPHIAYQSQHLPRNKRLPDDVINMITTADTVFVSSVYHSDPSTATKFPAHAGMNARSGQPGFMRVRPSDGRTVVLPDYSGNRFMSSLGNIESSGLAGFTIVDFTTGDVLYVTGTAKVLIGAPALEIMAKHASITVLETTGFTLVRDALPVRQREGTGVQRSPYSPKIKYLVEEAETQLSGSNGHKAVLESGVQLSDDLAVFKFRVDSKKNGVPPLQIRPGQAIVLDFMDWLGPPQYQHMADSAPGSINDDRVRTWTVSSAHENQHVTWFELTMREMEGGAVTGALFDILRKDPSNPWGRPVTIETGVVPEIVGVTGDFVLGEKEINALWVAGGIGVTPFLAMLGALGTRESLTGGDVVLALATREPDLMLSLLAALLRDVPSTARVKVDLFTSHPMKFSIEELTQRNVDISIHKGRIGPEYWKTVSKDKDVLICGPNEFGDAAADGLRAVGISGEKIQREGFY